jgi:hypothetical protein
MRMSPSTTLSALNGARTLWRWLRRSTPEESTLTPHEQALALQRERLRLHLEHQRELNALHAQEREGKMRSVMATFATVQSNKRQRTLTSVEPIEVDPTVIE